MDNEQSKFVKIMRNAIKNGNLDVVKELLGNNDGLLETNTVFGSWLHIAASYEFDSLNLGIYRRMDKWIK